MTRVIVFFALILSFSLSLTAPAMAQQAGDRAATGGAQTLEDILARQRGEKVEGRQRSPAYVEQVTKVWRQAIYCPRDYGLQILKHVILRTCSAVSWIVRLRVE